MARLERTFAIITTCKGRLDHLKQSLPRMVAQRANEVVVVDFSCPQGTSEFVAANFPSVRLVQVKGEQFFSVWKAKNAGASVATSDVLIFVDADTILADGAVDWLSEHLPEGAYGFFDRKASESFNRSGPRLAANQLRGFHVVPTASFRRVGGYDEILEGYAAGGDTDLEERLTMIRLLRHALDSSIIERVIEHDAASRTHHHAHPVRTSYCAGLLYRSAKLALLRMRGLVELPVRTRQNLYQAAMTTARSLGSNKDRAAMKVTINQEPIMMPRQLGYEAGAKTMTLHIEVSMRGKLSEIPE